jgi:hypothetical protein
VLTTPIPFAASLSSESSGFFNSGSDFSFNAIQHYVYQPVCAVQSRLREFAKMQVQRTVTGRVATRSRAQTVRVQAKVVKSPSDPRIVRGTCFVTRDVRVAGSSSSC